MSDLKPGQKFPTPTPGFGDRVFYETLLRQRPKSEMAQEWCVNYGVLPEAEAKKLFKLVTERKKKKGSSTAAAATPPKKKKKVTKTKVLSDSADPDMQMSGPERIGSTVL
mmetsp:Transcript_2295/g.2752  ORF Transcript_2295/g.2752 Transcript_2295/m.2752 type:complete len:110 (-) Transcript_2295:180-509(-)|eukprot:CAMPEP_0195267650 /NCGR_PEP_ID=MMETSP0706-20130129/12712_1 /TAXON_ID=33640 /ORGANISM="Asterionellopsis glacialis, Strain CCMP134" /LENGTH=109 /DNA_ID=CAMNT_0040322433 /DNA_START=110 /DNA_END=439 /DNA_ORIENTATION=-